MAGRPCRCGSRWASPHRIRRCADRSSRRRRDEEGYQPRIQLTKQPRTGCLRPPNKTCYSVPRQHNVVCLFFGMPMIAANYASRTTYMSADEPQNWRAARHRSFERRTTRDKVSVSRAATHPNSRRLNTTECSRRRPKFLRQCVLVDLDFGHFGATRRV